MVEGRALNGNGTNAIAIGYNASVGQSNSLILGNGCNVGIGTSNPNAPLQFSNGNANRKIVLWELANNDHQFNGLGITPTIFRFQVNQTTNDFVFYAGTSSTTSNEVGRITGTGTIYGRRVGGLLSSNGSGAFTPTAGALIKIPGVTTSSLLNQFTMPVNNRLLYTGNINIIIQVTLNVTMFTTTNTSTTLGVAINKNGLPITYATMYNTSTVANSLNNITASVLINMSANDYIEAFAYSSNASNINVQNMVLSIVAV